MEEESVPVPKEFMIHWLRHTVPWEITLTDARVWSSLRGLGFELGCRWAVGQLECGEREQPERQLGGLVPSREDRWENEKVPGERWLKGTASGLR